MCNAKSIDKPLKNNATAKVDPDEITYNRYQTQILREDSLISARMDWMCSFQGFLIASLALSVEKSTAFNSYIIQAISWLGFLSSLVALITIGLGIFSFNKLHTNWEVSFKNPSPSPFGLVNNRLSRTLNYSGLSVILPFLAAVFWIYILCTTPTVAS